MTQILITGANGLLGSAIARQFVEQGHKVFALCRAEADLSLLKEIKNKITLVEGDVLDVLSLEKAIKNMDFVVHTAAVVSFAPKDQNKLFKVNVEGTANVVNLCLEKKTKKLVFISSVAAIGRPANLTKNKDIYLNENQKWEESPLNSNYAKSKYLAENEVWRGDAEGLDVVIVNPSIVLGEGDWNRSSTQLFKYVFDKKPFYTSGNINYIDVKDLSEVVYKLAFSAIKAERFILNAGTISYKDFFEKIAINFGKKPPKIEVKTWMMKIIWRFEALRSMITGKAPLITKETTKTAKTKLVYENEKIKRAIDFEFTPLDQTIKRVSDFLMKPKEKSIK